MSGPVHLGEPLSEASPVQGCGGCAELNRQPETARRADDLSTVVNLSIELRNHPHGREGQL